MKPIARADGKNQLTLYTFDDPSFILKKTDLDRLYPYILRVVDKHSEGLLSTARGELVVEAISDSQAAFKIEGIDEKKASKLLSKIQEICKMYFTDTIVVPETLPGYPTIRHRIFNFEVDGDKMIVKYLTLGNFNNFDTAMEEIDNLYSENSLKNSFCEPDEPDNRLPPSSFENTNNPAETTNSSYWKCVLV